MKNSVVKVTPKRPIHRALISLSIGTLLSVSSLWANEESQSKNASQDGNCELSEQKREMLSRINEFRNQERQCGNQRFAVAKPLVWSCQLEQTAQLHSNDMADKDYFSHISPDGSDVQQRVNNSGYSWQAVGENIAAGHLSSGAAIEGWVESPGHCRNMMSDAFTEVGMANAQPGDSGSSHSSYWIQVLANPR